MRDISHLRELDESLKDWERYQGYSLDDLRRDRDKRNMVLHAMLVGVQAAIDIGSHLISLNGLKRPASYRETFQVLSYAGIIPEELANGLADLAGFRNVLVHSYWDLNMDEIYSIMQNDLRTLRSFESVIKELSGESEMRSNERDE
jgi:uncharacterized protein YutE (UPF0331/DUF86 family)